MNYLAVRTFWLCAGIPMALFGSSSLADDHGDRKQQYVETVVRGAGLMPWQESGPTTEERAFREQMEARKTRMLAGALPVRRPALWTAQELATARRNIASASWAREWFDKQREIADYVLTQPEGYIARLVPALTPWHMYGFTCPNCVGRLSQIGAGARLVEWNYREPDAIRCRECGQTYPDARFPETATLVCPRSHQTLTFYENDAERAKPEDRTGALAWRWVGQPMHPSFSGIVRYHKAAFAIRAARACALCYRMTGDSRYAAAAVALLDRLAQCYRNWLYHDYWDTVADCDPLYAAWHSRQLRLEWKRHLCTSAFIADTTRQAAMKQSYWGAGRLGASTDNIGLLVSICEAYDLVCDATTSDGQALWTAVQRERVVRDLLLEYVLGAEPFVGGEGQANDRSNKAPRIYHAQAAVARCLGLSALADTALRGYEGIRDEAFEYDGFSHETPGYNNMYLGPLVQIPEVLHNFDWSGAFPVRQSQHDWYASDARLALMYRASLDQLRPNGCHLPLGDSSVGSAPGSGLAEIGLYRYPEYFRGVLPALLDGKNPGEYAVMHLNPADVAQDDGLRLPEIFFPCWMTAILRHGTGPRASLLSLTATPPGNHRHADNLALFYEDGGDILLGDLGYVGDMPVNRWIHTTESHNLVVVDDQPQGRGTREPRVPALSLLCTTPLASVVEASSTAYPQCREYRRLAVLIKGPEGRTFVVDLFRVRGGRRHVYRVFSELASSDAADGALVPDGLRLPPEPPLPQVGASLEREDIFGLRDVRQDSAPPAEWSAVWSESRRSYRLWMRTTSDAVCAANGPGQEEHRKPGRRVRYMDTVREGDALASMFVAVHEPSLPDGGWAIRRVERLRVPRKAGPQAVALRIQSAWGTYLLLSEFAQEAKVEGVRFAGQFALLHEDNEMTTWLALGASTLKKGRMGFAGLVARWEGMVQEILDEQALQSATPRPPGWPEPVEACRTWLRIHDGRYWTGLPLAETGERTIRVMRFPLPAETTQFDLPALRYLTRAAKRQR